MDALDDPGMYLKEITDENRIDNILQDIKDKLGLKGKDELNFDKNDSWFEGNYDMLMEGTIWIPLNVNYFNSQAGSGSTITGRLGN